MQNLKFLPQRLFSTSDYAVVLLNREIHLEDAFFLKIWNNGKKIRMKLNINEGIYTFHIFHLSKWLYCIAAIVRHVIDGGTNHFFNFLDRQPESVKRCVKYPDIASGDFDSIKNESMSRLKESERSNCKVILTEDQDETDFTKGLRVLRDEFASRGSLDTLVYFASNDE